MKILFLLLTLNVTFATKNESVFRGAPKSADELKRSGIEKIEREKMTIKWLTTTFHFSDNARAQEIMDSTQIYKGPCPCPYNSTKNNSWCGGNSAYSKPGGAAPLCYPADVEKEHK